MKTVLISFLALAIIFTADAQQVPTSLVGNWISAVSNDWEYGFFEKFAVYNCSFWDYSAIQQQGKTVKIALQKDGKTICMEINQKNDSVLTIKNGKSKKQDFVLMRKRYPDYKTPDNTPLSEPQFKQDSATIIGYYRNFDKISETMSNAPLWAKERYLGDFKIAVNDFIADEQKEYQTEIDSLGRFSLTFPILNSQEVYADWGRLMRRIVFSPNDTLFIFADVADLVQPPNTDYWSDYIFYYSENKTIKANASQFLEESGLNTPENIQLFADYDELAKTIIAETDTAKQSELFIKNKELIENGNDLVSNPLIQEAQKAYNRRTLLDIKYHEADSLLQELALKELWLTKLYINDFEQTRIPWSDSDLQVMKTRVTNPFLLNKLLELNKYYTELNKQDFIYPASFIPTDDWANINDADSIFEKITAPYKGKVILMDFWGTWCDPCRRDMESSGDIKKAMRGKDIVFLYLANNSPESAWKNYIKKIQLTGEQIVHYRLPERQQSLLEQKLNVRSFPTYFIIDREGNIRNYELRFPLNFKNAVDELEKVLL
jgi:thiol-disulfide isomerase/thioredoxin